MTRVEDELKNALRRREPPQGFTHRVLARAAEIGSRQADHAWRELWLKIFDQPLAPANLLRWATVTVLAAGLVVGGVHYRSVQRERTQGEAAKQRLLLALRIAGRKLQLAKTRVDQINSGRVNSDQLHSDPRANQQERE
ncbi:MAG TPA: hypothetical protein VN833_14245 [Candidatus Acidoferrales bacterium]|jgi:hypothetical protein|nr:hypothetical protein [Candidatus Acidoferrales bacterium]